MSDSTIGQRSMEKQQVNIVGSADQRGLPKGAGRGDVGSFDV